MQSNVAEAAWMPSRPRLAGFLAFIVLSSLCGPGPVQQISHQCPMSIFSRFSDGGSLADGWCEWELL